MEIELMERLSSTTLQSKHLTHSRLKHLAATAQTSEDHVSRLGLGLSIAAGPVEAGWQPGEFDSEKSLTIEINEKHLISHNYSSEERLSSRAIWRFGWLWRYVIRHRGTMTSGDRS